MCPPPVRRANHIFNEGHIDAWLNTALCCTASFRVHQINNDIVCHECYLTESPRVGESYDSVSRHYIHIGYAERFEACSLCNVILPLNRPVSNCLVCRFAVDNFKEYLRRSQDRPFDSPEPTIISISQYRT